MWRNRRRALHGKPSRRRERMERFWDDEAGEYLENVKKEEGYYMDIIQHLVNEGHFKPGDGILDIACGPGTYSLLLAESLKLRQRGGR